MAEQNNSYPMISEKNWWTIRDKFKSTVPSVVSPNYVKTLLTMSSDNSANSNVISPLKRLGLIDDENKPTPLANDWRLDNKYAEVCKTLISNVYPTELLDLFPDTDIDRTVARNWFMGQGVGQGAADKMVALFILLKSGEIKDKKPTVKKATAPTKQKNVQDKSSNPKPNVTVTKIDVPQENKTSSINRPNLHIDLQIHISPDSTPEQIEAIFASMAKHLYGADN